MDQYQKMCMAAGLNYYRKFPTLTDLKKLSGMPTSKFIQYFDIFEFSFKLGHEIVGKKYEASDEETALRMVMKEKGNFIWTGESWITESEGLGILKNVDKNEIFSMCRGV